MKLLKNCCEKVGVEEATDLPAEDRIRRQTLFLKALADPARIRIVYALRNKELCACEIMALLDMPQTMVSHHCKILKIAGIVADRKAGKWVHYTLADRRALEMLEKIDA